MKIGLFTDSHYSSVEVPGCVRQHTKSLKKIEEAFEVFSRENCDFVICLGDLTDQENDHLKEIDNLKKVSTVFSKYDLNVRVVMGNHDAFSFEVDEFYDILGHQYRPENIFGESKNLIFLDACYFKTGVHYQPGDSDWTDTFYPKTSELEKILSVIKGDVYIFMHQNIDPEIEDELRLSNDGDVRQILENSNKVKIVFQGHNHPGCKSEINGIKYVTCRAMCEHEEEYYAIVEI